MATLQLFYVYQLVAGRWENQLDGHGCIVSYQASSRRQLMRQIRGQTNWAKGNCPGNIKVCKAN